MQDNQAVRYYKDIIDIEDYEIPDVKVKAAAGTKKKINYFD